MGIIDKILKNTAIDPESLYREGVELCRQGYYADAIVVLEKVIATDPGHARASQLNGFALYQLGSFEEALQYFDLALGLDPNLPDALVYKGLVSSNFGKPALALSLYDRALALHPSFIQAWYARGLTLAIQEHYTEAILAYEKVLTLDPKHTDALIGISVARKKQKNAIGETPPVMPLAPAPSSPGPVPGSLSPVAVPMAQVKKAGPQKSAEPSPASVPRYPSLPVTELPVPGAAPAPVGFSPSVTAPAGLSREAPGIPAGSSRVIPEKSQPEPVPEPAAPRCSSYNELIQELEANPDRVTDTDRWKALGFLYMKTGKYRDAVDSFERYLDLEPDNARVWQALGDARKKTGCYDEALSAYDRSLEIDPENSAAWINRAKDLVMLGDHEEAISSCNRAIALDPASVEAWLYKGFILNKIRRDDDAVAAYDRVLLLNPRDEQAVRQLKRIKGRA